jgi:acetyltransferase-like isoleucine patch superfamily enzyme
MIDRFRENANIGELVVIQEGVVLGKNVSIGHHTVILGNTRIGDNVTIGSHCIIGVYPGGNVNMRKTETTLPPLEIKSNVKIGNHVSIYTGTIISEEAFIGDQASIREKVLIGANTVIGRGAMVELNTSIGSHCTIQTLAYVTADTTIEDHVFIGPCVSMSNDKYMGAKEFTLKGPYIKEGAKIGNNASLLPAIIIGRNTVVGAGAVVTKSVPDYETVVGNPARKVPDDNILKRSENK